MYMIRWRPSGAVHLYSWAASDVYKGQVSGYTKGRRMPDLSISSDQAQYPKEGADAGPEWAEAAAAPQQKCDKANEMKLSSILIFARTRQDELSYTVFCLRYTV